MFNCLYCPFACKWDFSIKDHIQLHELQIINEQTNCCNEINKLNCFQCLYQSHSALKLHEHFLKIHKNNPDQIETEISLSIKVPNNQRLFECMQCSYKTKQKYNLKVHISKLHVSSDQIEWFSCPHCPAFKTKWKSCWRMHTATFHAPEHGYKSFGCTIEGCTFKTKWKSSLVSHFKVRHTEKPTHRYVQCPHCPFVTKRKCNLNKHILLRHTADDEIEWFQCPECPYKAKSRIYLKGHIAALHCPVDELTKIDCPHCPFKTKNDKLLKSHIQNRHTENVVKKPQIKRPRPKNLLSCMVENCLFTTFYKNNLRLHTLRKHSSEDVGEWVQCPHCDTYKSRKSCDLDKHILLRHTPDDQVKWFQCTLCAYKTKIKSPFNRHLKAVHKITNLNS